MKASRLKAWGNTKILPIACVFVLDKNDNLLLLQRHGEDLGGGKWGAPGGRLDAGEDAYGAVVRELREETGIEASKVDLMGLHEVRMPHGSVRMASFKTVVPNGTSVVIDSEEHHDYIWLNLDKIADHPGLLWGTPTILRDFGLLELKLDPTLADGSEAILLELAN